MGFRKPKQGPGARRGDDDRANNNQSSGRACDRCGGSGTITVNASDASGNTVQMEQDCPKCN